MDSKDRVDAVVSLGKHLDRYLPGPIYSLGKALFHAYLENGVLNRIRRTRDYYILRVKSRMGNAPSELHLGCGQEESDMCDIDLIKTPTTNYVLDAGNLPFESNSIDRIESYHMIEHIPKDKIPLLLAEWGRVLRSGGLLVLELPAFDEVLQEYLETTDPEYEQTLLRYIFGSQRFDSDHHFWGWNEERLGEVLLENGFSSITRKPGTDNHADEAPCMRIEARRT